MLSTPQTRLFVRHVGRRSLTSSHNAIASKLPKPLKRRVRGGQNLSERFKRLENSLRGKDAMRRELAAKSSPLPSHLASRIVTPAVSFARTHSFHGFHVPQEPRAPADDECCMSGCAVCVYDLHEEAVAAYKDEVDALRTALTGMKIPESEWPPHIRLQQCSNAAVSTEAQRKEKILAAFEEMERALALKKQKQKQIEIDRNLRLHGQQERREHLVHLAAPRSLVFELYHFIQWVLFSRRWRRTHVNSHHVQHVAPDSNEPQN